MNAEPDPHAAPGVRPKSKWPKILGIGCGGLLVLLVLGVVAVNFYLKRAMVEHLERKMADAGLSGQIGEFDYSIRDRTMSVRNLTATPSDSRLAGLGEVTMAEASLQFDLDESKRIARVSVNGLESAQLSVGNMEFEPGRSMQATAVTVKATKGFGDGDFLKISNLQVAYGTKGLDRLQVDVSELAVIKNRDGKWNLLIRPVKELKFMGRKVDRIGEVVLQVKSVRVVDLASESSAQVVPVNKTIRARDINSAAEFNAQILPALRGLLAEARAGGR